MKTEINCTSLEQGKTKAIGLIHRVYLTQLKNARQHTASTKTKSEVRGGGRKPWRQKGTGNARAGSIRSPLFVGGGVMFGPKPHLVSKKANKKEKRLAILCALYFKRKQSFLLPEKNLYLESFEQSTSFWKTKDIVSLVQRVDGQTKKPKKMLFVVANPIKCRAFIRGIRNIQNIMVVPAKSLNLIVLLKAENVLLTTESLEIINSLYGNLYESSKYKKRS